MGKQRLIYTNEPSYINQPSLVKKEVQNTKTKEPSVNKERMSERKKVWGSRLILALIGASLTTPFQFVAVHDPHRHWWPFGPISNVLEGIGIVFCYMLMITATVAIVGCTLVTLVWVLHVLIMTSLRKKHMTWKEWW